MLFKESYNRSQIDYTVIKDNLRKEMGMMITGGTVFEFKDKRANNVIQSATDVSTDHS